MRRLPFLLLGALLLLAAAAPILPMADPLVQDVGRRLAPPSADAWLGRDEVGRDVLSRLIWGARSSLSFAAISALLAAAAGILLGLLGAWLRGWSELVTIRLVDVILCFPPILLAMLVTTLLGPGGGVLVFIMAVLFVPGFARVTYAQTLSARKLDYVEAVRALGARTPRILGLTVLPNIAGPLLVQFSLTVATALILESGLSFLGLGIPAPAPSWGRMAAGARATMMQAPLLLLWPSLALIATILLLNQVCDRLRDRFDPKGRTMEGALPLPPRRPAGRTTPGKGDALLRVEGLSVAVARPQGPVTLVENVGFSLRPGQTLALVGERGSGKSISAAAVMGLLPEGAGVVQGSAWLDGADVLELDEAGLRKLRGTRMAMVFQDPMSSLHPMQRVGDQVAEAITVHRAIGRPAALAEALALFRRVGIADPERRMQSYPHEMSGGMRQRVMIAMAIANRPGLLIADEPTTALDVTVQAQIIALLKELQRQDGMGLIFISHDIALVREVADRVAVMYAGQIVEEGPANQVLNAPRHPYSRALIAASPEGEDMPVGIPGVVPRAGMMPEGCRFAPRCALAAPACHETPQRSEVLPDGQVRCMRWRDLLTAKEAVCA